MDQLVSNIYRHTSEGIVAYGNLWEPKYDEIAIEALIYEDDSLRQSLPGGKAAYIHWARLVQHLQPANRFAWNRWVWECAELWCDNKWFTVIGPSSSGKSCTFGVFALCDWAIDPCETTTVMVSTTLEMVKERIYKFAVEHHGYLPAAYKWDAPFVHNERQVQTIFRQATPLGILIQDIDNATLTGAGIKCVGFKAGESLETIKAQLGRHAKRNRLLVDELQGTSRAVLKLPVNFGASGKFKFGGFGNPSDYMDPLADASEPADGVAAWPLIDKKLRELSPDGEPYLTKKFKTKKGECLFLDGLECPSMREPALYPYLLDPAHVRETIKEEGINSAMVDTYIRGIFPSGSEATVVLDADEAAACQVAQTNVLWANQPDDWIALDLSHSGTDAKIARRLRVGMVDRPDGPPRECIKSVEFATIKTNSDTRIYGTISRQIARQVHALMIKWAVPINRVGGDSTATQGAALDAIEEEAGEIGIKRMSFAGAASDKPVKQGWPRLCKEEYANRASELAGIFRELCLSGMIRGLDAVTMQQAAQRRWLTPSEKEEEAKAAKQIDPNKRIGGKSCDELDTMLVGCAMLRDFAGIYPRSKVPLAHAAPEEKQWHGYAQRDSRRGGSRIAALVQGQGKQWGQPGHPSRTRPGFHPFGKW